MILDEVGSYLEAQGLVGGATGWPWFQALTPATPDQCVVLFEAGGEGRPVSTSDLLGLEQPRFQIKVRGKALKDDPAAYGTARAKLQAILDVLHGLTGATFSSASYPYIFAQGNALPLGQDENGRPEVVHNFRCAREG